MKFLYAATLLFAALLSDGSLPVLADEHAGSSFSYEGPEGPSNWAELFPTCGGKSQSPINIEEHLVQNVRLAPLEFKGFDKIPKSSTLSNNGHTAMLRLDTARPATVSGGPLTGKYIFAQLHFHWGNNDSVGSENRVNNHTFPFELHIVTYNEKYGSADKAQKYKGGLAVLGVFYEIYGEDNEVYSEIIELLPQVKQADTQVQIKKGIRLSSLLPETKHLYFTFDGSLTTPPCSEVVTWIVFKQPLLLSHNQVSAFRTLYTTEGQMTHNYRPVQPLNGRIVKFNVGGKCD